ncbi:hypothetical protein CEV32_4057 [Brucella rhizosphaerae]|uniref:Uncharacterized protein n=1 Tax=Brucella rhizosphaerae TaxID=571254 RepID=A0A256FQV5_9HYPH|nr:hypothetical protein CEV32_4057 [Brucella rhizosphaerae]
MDFAGIFTSWDGQFCSVPRLSRRSSRALGLARSFGRLLLGLSKSKSCCGLSGCGGRGLPGAFGCSCVGRA